MEKHLHLLLCLVCACAFAPAQTGRPTTTPSDSGLVAEMLSLKDINCEYKRTDGKITVTTIKEYSNGKEEKHEPLPVVYVTYKQAMTACGEWFDRIIADRTYAILYRRNTVEARK